MRHRWEGEAANSGETCANFKNLEDDIIVMEVALRDKERKTEARLQISETAPQKKSRVSGVQEAFREVQEGGKKIKHTQERQEARYAQQRGEL